MEYALLVQGLKYNNDKDSDLLKQSAGGGNAFGWWFNYRLITQHTCIRMQYGQIVLSEIDHAK